MKYLFSSSSSVRMTRVSSCGAVILTISTSVRPRRARRSTGRSVRRERWDCGDSCQRDQTIEWNWYITFLTKPLQLACILKKKDFALEKSAFGKCQTRTRHFATSYLLLERNCLFSKSLNYFINLVVFAGFNFHLWLMIIYSFSNYLMLHRTKQTNI